MKIFKTAAVAAVAALAMTSCDGTPDVAGSWNIPATSLSQTGTQDAPGGVLVNSLVTTTVTFTPDKDNNRQGTITLNSMVNIDDTWSLANDTDILQTYEVSVAGTASISGTYQFVNDEDDEMTASFDFANMSVNVDPEAVKFRTNVLDGQQSPELDTLKDGKLAEYTRDLNGKLKAYYTQFQKIDDIKVTDGMMSCEIGDRDFTFRRQDQAK